MRSNGAQIRPWSEFKPEPLVDTGRRDLSVVLRTIDADDERILRPAVGSSIKLTDHQPGRHINRPVAQARTVRHIRMSRANHWRGRIFRYPIHTRIPHDQSRPLRDALPANNRSHALLSLQPGSGRNPAFADLELGVTTDLGLARSLDVFSSDQGAGQEIHAPESLGRVAGPVDHVSRKPVRPASFSVPRSLGLRTSFPDIVSTLDRHIEL